MKRIKYNRYIVKTNTKVYISLAHFATSNNINPSTVTKAVSRKMKDTFERDFVFNGIKATIVKVYNQS